MSLKPSKGKIIGFLGLFVVLGLFLPRLLRRTSATFVVLRAQDAVETVLATGRIVGEKTIPLSFVRPGRIAEELISDGDKVKSGQILMRQENVREGNAISQKRNALAVARLNLEKLRTVDLRDAQQKVRQARATAAYASDYFQRQSELIKQNSITTLQFDQAKRDRELAEAALQVSEIQLESLQNVQKGLAELQVSQAENDLRKAEIDLQETVLRAPFDGQILEHLAHKGESVPGGGKIITFIPSTPRTYLEIQVDESSSGKLVKGQRATVSSAAFAGRIYPATVERIASIVDTQRGTFTVRLMMDKLVAELLPESSVSVQIVSGEAKGVFLIEQRFLVLQERDAFVFTADGNRAKRIPVTARDLGNGLYSIDSELKSGDLVLLPQGLKDGAKVKPVPAKVS